MERQKLCILDLDGVLIDSRELHFQALNDALTTISEQYIINRDEHLSSFDGLPTKKKLQILTNQRGLSIELYDKIYELKQKTTMELLEKSIDIDYKLIEICKYLQNNNYKIAIASNAIRKTVRKSLICLGIMDYIDIYLSNEDVKNAKPSPDIYFQCMMLMNAIPSTTIIVEDSHIGREGAIASGAQLLAVENPNDLTLEKIKNIVENKNNTKVNMPWRSKKLNVLIPMAGAGSRFAAAGYTFPKPLIEVDGKPMIQTVVENLNMEAHFIFIVQREHYEKYNLKYMLQLIAPDCDIIQIDGMTEGAACTTLTAAHLYNNENPLVIANSDQFIDWNSNEVMYSFAADDIDGGILTFKSTHPKWSYAKLDDKGFVSEVAEKKVISDNATVGVYYWKHGSDYCKYAMQMIDANDRTNGEFYVAPSFNYAIKSGLKIKVKEVPGMWGIGEPESLKIFLDKQRTTS